MRYLIISILALLAGCTGEPIHQGNRLDVNQSAGIRQGDSRFHVEQALGSPVLKDVLHPRRAIYYEAYQDEVGSEMHRRRIVVSYDNAGRVSSIERIGLNNNIRTDP
ncbi:MAG: outer membrane protein assembly factor BamE [Mariprofundus sp.]